MPRIEDFPPVVQAEMEHHRGPGEAAAAQDERGPMGLLKRLSSSLGRREDEEQQPAAAPTQPAPTGERRALSAEASLYAPQRGNLDNQGREQPKQAQQSEDDQLEIPAFLRRQAM